MSKTRLAFALRREVAAHFDFRCAYCQSREAVVGMHFTVDHIVPEVFGGSSDPRNLCLACWDCNLAKGGRVAATDPLTSQLAPLYHPRKQAWGEHFGRMKGYTLQGERSRHSRCVNAQPRGACAGETVLDRGGLASAR